MSTPTIHAAQVTEWGRPPVYTQIPAPSPTPDSLTIKVLATGLHQVVRSRASGRHYTSGSLPHLPGIDGVGVLPSSKKVYFNAFQGGGSFAETVVVPAKDVTTIPEGLDPVQVAALMNPAYSSWMAMTARTQGLQPGFTVLIMGVTSASGSIASELARAKGAGKVIGVARSEEKMAALKLDQGIVLKTPPGETDFGSVGDVDLILDYVYGEPIKHLLQSLKTRKPVQYVHIGSLDSQVMDLTGSVLRSKDITIRGAGPGSWSWQHMMEELPALLDAFKRLEKRDIRTVPLSDVEQVWIQGKERLVFLP